MEDQTAQALTFVEEAKEAVLQLEAAKAQNQSLSQRELRLKKQLAAEEQALADETASTIRKRREELSAGFDREISAAQEELRKLKNQKEQAKNAGKKERIQTETASKREDNSRLKDELKTLLKKNRVPKLCRRRWFFVLFMPKGLWEHVVDLMLALLTLLLLPYLVFGLLPTQEPLVLSLLHGACTVIFGGGYLFLNNHVKYSHLQTLEKACELRRRIEQNDRQIRLVATSIRKDAGEEHYDLADYNYNIAKAEAQIEEIGSKKQEALQTFEAVTSRVIADELAEGSKKKMDKLQKQIEENHQELTSVKEQVSALSIQVTDRYAGRLGKEHLQTETLEQIAKQLRSGNASTITDALSRI
jgi:hypothetical protein